MAFAFGHLDDARCVPALHRLRAHPDADVRHAVAFGLLGHDDDLAVATLIELSRDADAVVRDWATFGLGTQLDRDDPPLRAALLARLDDPDASSEPDERDPAFDDALLALAAAHPDERLCAHVATRLRAWERERPDEPPWDDLRRAADACRRLAAGG